MIQKVLPASFTVNALPHKFEAGTPNIAGSVAFGAALDYLKSVGLENALKHERELTRRAMEVLSVPGVKIYGPKDVAKRGGVVAFNIEGIHPHDVGTAFDLEGVAIRAGHHCCQPLMCRLMVPGTARASFYLYNDFNDIEVLGRALARTMDFFRRPRKAAPKKTALARVKGGL
jgi:cysteine desulfurase/selenocysteine lyase